MWKAEWKTERAAKAEALTALTVKLEFPAQEN